MKHLKTISAATPAKAALWQEIICQFSRMLGQLLESLGGASPIVDYLNNKCDLPG